MNKKKNFKKYHSPKAKKKKKNNILKNKYFWFSLLGIIIFSGLFYLVSFSPWVQIESINISGNEEVLTRNIEFIIEEQINKRILFIETESIFLISSKNINNNLLEAFPKIDNVKIKRKLFNTLNISIEERGPSAIFCRKEFCLFIDQKGIGYKIANKEENFIIVVDKTKEELLLKEEAISKTDLNNIIKIDDTLNELSINSIEYLIWFDKLIVAIEGEWEIYFDLNKDINWQLTKLRTVLDKEIQDRSILDYIELRFGNLSPYKVD